MTRSSESEANEGIEVTDPIATPFPLTPADEAAIRAAAEAALARSFAILRQERVLPRSRYERWIRVGTDYEGWAIEGSEGTLAKRLAEALPDRFDLHRNSGIDLPWSYPTALLEAAVAAATRAGEAYDPKSPSVQKCVAELVLTVQALPRAKVVQIVSDIDVAHEAGEGHGDRFGEELTIAGVKVIRVGNQAERFVEREVPSAGFDIARSDAFAWPGPTALLLAEEIGRAKYEELQHHARRRVWLVTSAIRLATASTLHALVDIAGQPGLVHAHPPNVTRLPHWGFRFVHRPVTLDEVVVPGIESLVALLDELVTPGRWDSPLTIALGRLGRSLDGTMQSLVDQAVDLAVGLEAALAGTARNDIALRLRSRAAHLLGTEQDPPEAIYEDVKILYELRSTFVHGATMSREKIDEKIAAVTGSDATEWKGEQFLLALDRWRDLLRRAIIARIALGYGSSPAWPLGNRKGNASLDVDRVLLGASSRAAWTSRVAQFWGTRGLPGAAGPCQPPEFMIARPIADQPRADQEVRSSEQGADDEQVAGR